jgi:dTMP kinase
MEEFTMTKNKGKLIVIDGTDGSGKATQVALLSARLKKEGYTVKNVDFPEYYENFFGKFIGHCLSEQYYNFVKVHPKIASVLYAADRFESKDKMTQWLSKGYIIIANRYVSANQIHQGGKIKSAVKRQAFIEWLDEMEYKVFKIPRPNVVFYLELPIDIVKKLINERNKAAARTYLGNKKDVHEKDIDFLINSRNSALWLAKTQKNYVKIECAQKKEILSREVIHEMVYEKVKKILK